jgi:hypothetical protein
MVKKKHDKKRQEINGLKLKRMIPVSINMPISLVKNLLILMKKSDLKLLTYFKMKSMAGETLFFGYENITEINNLIPTQIFLPNLADMLDYTPCEEIVQEEDGFKLC